MGSPLFGLHGLDLHLNEEHNRDKRSCIETGSEKVPKPLFETQWAKKF